MGDYAVDLRDIRAAGERIASHIHRTPLWTCAHLDRLSGRTLLLKCENLQKGGAFKARGATNAVWSLDEASAARGVVTHSSGNHAQALARAARSRGIVAHVVMPTNAPRVKREATEAYGAHVHPCEPTLEARERGAADIVASTGATLVPPYDHPWVIAGQGTVALEILGQSGGVDAIVAPVGGGGLVSGIALACREQAPGVDIVAAEPAGADDAARSRRAGERLPQLHPETIADGLRTSLGELTWPVVRDLVKDIVTVDDRAIVGAMRLLFERAKLVVEPSGAVALAAVLDPAFDPDRRYQTVAIVLSGGNVSLDRFFADYA